MVNFITTRLDVSMGSDFASLLDDEGWMPCGEPGLEVKVLANSLDPTTSRGVRIQAFRAAPGTLVRPDDHASPYWQEFLLVQGSLTVHGVRQVAPARATRPHDALLDDALTEDGCLLIEVAQF